MSFFEISMPKCGILPIYSSIGTISTLTGFKRCIFSGSYLYASNNAFLVLSNCICFKSTILDEPDLLNIYEFTSLLSLPSYFIGVDRLGGFPEPDYSAEDFSEPNFIC